MGEKLITYIFWKYLIISDVLLIRQKSEGLVKMWWLFSQCWNAADDPPVTAFTGAKAISTCQYGAEGSSLLSWYLQDFFTPFPSPFHTTHLVPLLLEQKRRKFQAYEVDAKSQPQPWTGIWLMGWRGTSTTVGWETKLRKWFRVNEIHTNNQCVSNRPDLTYRF